MRQIGTHNFGAYAWKMLIDGHIIKADPLSKEPGNLVIAGRIHPEKLAPNRFAGLENVEPALILIENKMKLGIAR